MALLLPQPGVGPAEPTIRAYFEFVPAGAVAAGGVVAGAVAFALFVASTAGVVIEFVVGASGFTGAGAGVLGAVVGGRAVCRGCSIAAPNSDDA